MISADSIEITKFFEDPTFYSFITWDSIQEEIKKYSPSNNGGINPVPPSYVLFSGRKGDDNNESILVKAFSDINSKRCELIASVANLWLDHIQSIHNNEPSTLSQMIKEEDVNDPPPTMFQRLMGKIKVPKKDEATDKVFECFVSALGLTQDAEELCRKEKHGFCALWSKYQKKVIQEIALAFVGRKNAPNLLEKECSVENNLDAIQEKLQCYKVPVEEVTTKITEVKNWHPAHLLMKERISRADRDFTFNFDKQFYESVFMLTACGEHRKLNEDRTLCEFFSMDVNGKVTKVSCYGVFDGHAGESDIDAASGCSDCVDFVRSRFINVFQLKLDEFSNQPMDLRIYNALTQTFLELQNEWTQHVLYSVDKYGIEMDISGTTACVVVRINSTFYCANLGDSRAIIAFPDGYYPLSEDMKCDKSPYREMITARGGEVIEKSGDCARLEGHLAMAGAL